ncbi:hypothetical protein diail_3839 [Diaporthe ilicicola]|nr:hypothetical protein diail_3839 [Diaporthe ilicicola]
MCHYEQTDMMCASPNCTTIIHAKAKVKKVECSKAKREKLKWGKCPNMNLTRFHLPARKLDSLMCGPCTRSQREYEQACRDHEAYLASRPARHGRGADEDHAILSGIGLWSGGESENAGDLNFDFLDQQPEGSHEDYEQGSSQGYGQGYGQSSGSSSHQ